MEYDKWKLIKYFFEALGYEKLTFKRIENGESDILITFKEGRLGFKMKDD